MAKFTRTAYASGPLGAIAREIAYQSGVTGENGNVFAYDTLHPRGAKGRKRVRITIEVKPEKASQRLRGPKGKRPEQGSLPLEVATGQDPWLDRMQENVEQIKDMNRASMHSADAKHFRMPLYGADGGAT